MSKKIVNVYVTTDYDIFQSITGNRPLNKVHLVNLAKSFAEDDLSSEVPIVVNEKMQVIDGQHRLEFRRHDGLPIYYTIKEGATLKAVQLLNRMSRQWTISDFLASYVELGKPAYVRFNELQQEYKLNNTAARFLFAVTPDSRTFKGGDLELVDEETMVMRAEALNLFKGVVEAGIINDRDFVRAVLQLMETVSVEELIHKMSASGKTIEYGRLTKDYLRQFENILNWKRQGEAIRLF